MQSVFPLTKLCAHTQIFETSLTHKFAALTHIMRIMQGDTCSCTNISHFHNVAQMAKSLRTLAIKIRGNTERRAIFF